MAKPHAKKQNFKKEPKEFEEEVIQIDRVTRVVKGGRRLRFRATVVIGDRKNRVGIGIGKSNEVSGAIQKAVAKAKKGLINVPITHKTIPHKINTKYKSAKVLLLPAAPGTGIIAGGAVRKVLDLAGIHNVLSKSIGSSNRVNCTKAAYKALSSLRKNPHLKYKIENEEKVVKYTDKKNIAPNKKMNNNSKKDHKKDNKKSNDNKKHNKTESKESVKKDSDK